MSTQPRRTRPENFIGKLADLERARDAVYPPCACGGLRPVCRYCGTCGDCGWCRACYDHSIHGKLSFAGGQDLTMRSPNRHLSPMVPVRNLAFYRTCAACPEQYDVYKTKRQVGYVRVRWGRFSVSCPDSGEEEVLAVKLADPMQGVLDDTEPNVGPYDWASEQRLARLDLAAEAIHAWMKENT